jgi:hypothetical protein
MWSHMSPRTKRTSGPEKFRSSAKKDFFNTICQKQIGGNLGIACCLGFPVEGIGFDMIQTPKRSLESCGIN